MGFFLNAWRQCFFYAINSIAFGEQPEEYFDVFVEIDGKWNNFCENVKILYSALYFNCMWLLCIGDTRCH